MSPTTNWEKATLNETVCDLYQKNMKFQFLLVAPSVFRCCAMIRWITSERDRPSALAISSRPTICPLVTKVTTRWERASFRSRLGLPSRFDLSAVRCFASMICSSKGFLGTCQLKWHQEGPLVLICRIQLQIVRKGMLHSHDRAGYSQRGHVKIVGY